MKVEELTIPTDASDDEKNTDDENADVVESTLKHSEVWLQIDRTKEYACKEDLESLYAKLNECTNIVQDAICSKNSIQISIVEFLSK